MSVVSRYIALVVFSTLVSACTSSSPEFFGVSDSTTGSTIPGQTTQTALEDTTELSDKEAIKKAVLSADKSDQSLALAWANQKTGNSGTITAIEEAISNEGKRCYRFLTTLETYTGISLYDAETCEMTAGEWVMSFFQSKNAA